MFKADSINNYSQCCRAGDYLILSDSKAYPSGCKAEFVPFWQEKIFRSAPAFVK